MKSKNELFLEAALKNNIEELEHFITDPEVDRNTLNPNGYSALMLAAYSGNVEAVEVLVRHHVNLEIVGIKRLTALGLVIDEHGNDKPTLATEIAKKLIAAGANVHTQDIYGWYTLHLAANAGLDETVRAMLKKGIPNIDVLGQKNATPLMVTARRGHQSMLKLLLLGGADRSKHNTEGNDAYKIAIGNHHFECATTLTSYYPLSNQRLSIFSNGDLRISSTQFTYRNSATSRTTISSGTVVGASSIQINDTRYPVQEGEQLEISRGYSNIRPGGSSTGDS